MRRFNLRSARFIENGKQQGHQYWSNGPEDGIGKVVVKQILQGLGVLREQWAQVGVRIVQVLCDRPRVGDDHRPSAGRSAGRIDYYRQRVVWATVGLLGRGASANFAHSRRNVGIFQPDRLVRNPFEVENEPAMSLELHPNGKTLHNAWR